MSILRSALPRRSTAAATAVLATLALSGCGSTSEEAGTDESSSPESSTSSSEPTSESASTPTESPEPTESDPAQTGDSVQGDGYSLVAPEGWTDLSDQAKKVPQLALADLAYGDTGEAKFASNFNTIVTPAGGESVDDEGIREQLAAQVESAIGVRPEPIDDIEIDGEKAIGQSAVVEDAGATLIQYVAVHDDMAYTLTVTLSEDRAADSDAIVSGIVDSWQWD